jgi:prepilin peptidase CpaA
MEPSLVLSDYLLILLMSVCVYTDVSKNRIYNIVLLPFVIAALLTSLCSGGITQLLWSIKGMLLGLAILFIPFALGGMGAGDVKLLGVVGALKGPFFVLSVFLTGAVAGGLLSLLIMSRAGRLKVTLLRHLARYYPALLAGSENYSRECAPMTMPYALAIGSGVILTYLNILHIS